MTVWKNKKRKGKEFLAVCVGVYPVQMMVDIYFCSQSTWERYRFQSSHWVGLTLRESPFHFLEFTPPVAIFFPLSFVTGYVRNRGYYLGLSLRKSNLTDGFYECRLGRSGVSLLPYNPDSQRRLLTTVSRIRLNFHERKTRGEYV